MVTATANAWVEFDPRSQSVFVLGKSFHIGQGDSTRVVLVDRVDHVGGERVISVVTVVCHAKATSPRPADVMGTGVRESIDRWDGCVKTNLRIAAFVKGATVP